MGKDRHKSEENCCSLVEVGDIGDLDISYDLNCGQSSPTLYEADNLDCFPTVTVSTEVFGSANPCIAILVFVLENGRIIEKEIGRFISEEGFVVSGPVFTVGNVRRIFVRCDGGGTEGCRGRINMFLSYCGVNKCDSD